MSEILIKKIEDKNIVWFQNSNSYLVFENLITDVILKINNKIDLLEIENWCSLQLNIPKDTAKKLVKDILTLYESQTKKTEDHNSVSSIDLVVPTTCYSLKHYLINEILFSIQFETEFHESLVHPKFAHLETFKNSNPKKVYQVFNNNNNIVFFKNGTLIDQWVKNEIHLFQGKLSMHILMDIYEKTEEDWLGVFHASAVTNGKDSMLFLGDSGNGKSTSLALLNANGFNCLADDFVPVDSDKKIRAYPAAISIKKNSLDALLPFYPELKEAAEFHFKRLNKIVRYLPPKEIKYNIQSSCKAFIFIKYDKNIELEVTLISKTYGFEQLIPDSWISPLKNNVNLFLDWFLELPCYQLTYSDNEKMIETVSKIFNDEL